MNTKLIIINSHGIIWISFLRNSILILTASLLNGYFEIDVWNKDRWETVASFYLDGRSND